MRASRRMANQDDFVSTPSSKSFGLNIAMDPLANQLYIIRATRVLNVWDQLVISNYSNDSMLSEEIANIGITLDVIAVHQQQVSCQSYGKIYLLTPAFVTRVETTSVNVKHNWLVCILIRRDIDI